jgi:hypothetical protein
VLTLGLSTTVNWECYQHAVPGKIRRFKVARKQRLMESDLDMFIEEKRRKVEK